jgi:hypothetical protein
VISLGIDGPAAPDHPVAVFQDFARGIERIRQDLARCRFSGAFLAWDKDYPAGCPTNREVPFAFKPFCFREAKAQAFEAVLWLDSSIKIRKPIDVLFELIREDGYLIFQGSHSVGEYCKDDALLPLGIGREESFAIPCCSASVLGLNLKDGRAQEFLLRWLELACDGVTFPGAKWSGVRGWPQTVSSDPRVKGHRHDQTAASVIALKLGMNNWQSKSFFHDYFENERQYVRG